MLPALLLLLVPATNYVLLKENFDAQRAEKRDADAMLLDTIANIVAYDLSLLGNPEAYAADQKPLFANRTEAEIDLDGRSEDWLFQQGLELGAEHVTTEHANYDSDSLQIQVNTLQNATHLFLFFEVTDNAVVYREISNISIHRNDHIRLAGIDANGNFQRYTLATQQPGTIYGRVVSTGGRALRREPRIEGVWRATDSGYHVEVKLDKSLFSGALAFGIADVDDTTHRDILYVLGSGETDSIAGLNPLVGPSSRLARLFQQLGVSQINFLDRYGNLLAGQQLPPSMPSISKPLIVDDIEYGTLNLAVDLSHIEQQQNSSTIKVYWLSGFSLLFALLVCALLASHTLRRLKKLGQAVATVVDDQGRVKGRLDHPVDSDAVGDMTRQFMLITERLQQYNEYLELLSRRLAHELRTPVSVVRSSLENLSEGLNEEQLKFVTRANNGVARLTNILNSMSEASRLEQSLDQEEVTIFELSGLVQGCVEGYEHAFPEQKFELINEGVELKVTGIPELLAQMLDKLVDNARQFSEPDQPVIVRISSTPDLAVVRISNSGPELPDTLNQNLFDPMISLRESSASEDSHLGLGLYVARIITEFHGGSISLKNREDRQGAVATVKVPLMRITAKL